MSKKGAFWIHREIEDHWLWKRRPFSPGQVWIDMILLANHKDNKTPYKNQIVEIKRSEFIRSERDLAMRWGWSKSKVHDFLKLLVGDSMITIKSDQKANRISILNYNEYQILPTNKRPKKDQSPTSSRPVADLNNNDKNDKNEKKTNIHIPEFLGESVWKRFLNHRKNVKAPISNDSWESFFKKFNNLKEQGYNPEFVLDTMIEKGWRWFKPEWVKKNGITEDDKRAASYFLSDLGKNSDE